MCGNLTFFSTFPHLISQNQPIICGNLTFLGTFPQMMGIREKIKILVVNSEQYLYICNEYLKRLTYERNGIRDRESQVGP